MWQTVVIASAAGILAGSAPLLAQTSAFRCKATDPRSKKLVFTCSGRETKRGQALVSAEITYRDARGRVFGREKINFRKDQKSPDVLFQDLRDGRREMIEKDNGGYSIILQDSAKAAPQFARLAGPGGDETALTMPGLPVFLGEKMASLPAGEKFTFYCIFPHERKMLKLRATLEAVVQYQRRDAMRIRVQPQNFVYRWFSEPVFLTIVKKGNRLVRYQGLHYVRDPETGHGSIVDLTFSW